MAEPMWVITITHDEWTWLNRMDLSAAGVPEGFKFAIQSAVPAQSYMTYERSWVERQPE